MVTRLGGELLMSGTIALTDGMKRVTGTALAAASLVVGLWWLSTPPAHADEPALCQYQLGAKVATIRCDSDPRAEPGMAGNMPEDRGPDSAIAQFEREQQRQREELLRTGGRSGWYPGCNTTPMC